MAEQFYTILTNIGKAKIANSLPTGQKLNLVKMKIGDGNGKYYNPSENQTDLVHKIYECNVTSVEVDENNPQWITITSAIPSDVGGFSIREVGVFDDTNSLIAIGKYPETYKPVASDGSTKELYIKMTLEVTNAASVEFKIDPTVILATKKDINTLDKKIENNTTQLNDIANNFTNAKNPILTPTYDGSYQSMHPKVLYFESGWGVGNWRYYMATTPYTDTDDAYENPCILVSQTGKEFLNPTGLINPIDKPTEDEIASGGHMSDTHLVMVNNTMECWYRYNPGNGDGTPNNNITKIYKKTSTDGVNWSSRIEVFSLENNQFLAPCVNYEANKYKLWYISSGKMYYRESSNGTVWSNDTQCVVPIVDGSSLWHGDIIKTDLGYEMVMSCRDKTNNMKYRLYYSLSKDGINWTTLKCIIEPSSEYIAWDNRAIYRSSILKIGDLYKIYYSANRSGGQWYTGLTQGYSIDNLRGHDLNTFYEKIVFWEDIQILLNKSLKIGGNDGLAINRNGISFNDNPSSFNRNLVSLVNKGVAGAKLKVETDKDTISVRTDSDTNYGNLVLNSLVLMHTLSALAKEGSIAYSSLAKSIQVYNGISWLTLFANGNNKLDLKGTTYAATSIKSSETDGDTIEIVQTGKTSIHANQKVNSIQFTADAAALAKEGTIAWNKTTKKPMYYNGASWIDIG